MPIKYQSKKLIGNRVSITARNSNDLLNLKFDSYCFSAILLDVSETHITIKKQSGMIQTVPFKDKYITIEKIE